jgi:hypothetical protein
MSNDTLEPGIVSVYFCKLSFFSPLSPERRGDGSEEDVVA